MVTRRNFIKASILAVGASPAIPLAVKGSPSIQSVADTVNISEHPEKPSKKASCHAPVVTQQEEQITVETRHCMNESHYIVRHTLITEDGQVIGKKIFSQRDDRAVSTFHVPRGTGACYATSFCNKHDLWVTAFTI